MSGFEHLVIGPNLELTFRLSIQILDHSPANLISHPITILFIVLTAVIVYMIGRSHRRAAIMQHQDAHQTKLHN